MLQINLTNSRFPFRALSKFHIYFDILHQHVSTACYVVLRRLCNNLNMNMCRKTFVRIKTESCICFVLINSNINTFYNKFASIIMISFSKIKCNKIPLKYLRFVFYLWYFISSFVYTTIK